MEFPSSGIVHTVDWNRIFSSHGHNPNTHASIVPLDRNAHAVVVAVAVVVVLVVMLLARVSGACSVAPPCFRSSRRFVECYSICAYFDNYYCCYYCYGCWWVGLEEILITKEILITNASGQRLSLLVRCCPVPSFFFQKKKEKNDNAKRKERRAHIFDEKKTLIKFPFKKKLK